jgi:hypothetical protein
VKTDHFEIVHRQPVFLSVDITTFSTLQKLCRKVQKSQVHSFAIVYKENILRDFDTMHL